MFRFYKVLSMMLFYAFLFSAVQGAAQYRQALPGYRYEFPRDHFDHPDFQTEWWYYTGNLRDSHGRRFGFELTFFRQGLSRQRQLNTWSIQDLYMAHLAVSDLQSGKFYRTERMNRSGPGIAGSNAASGRIWNGNWQTILKSDTHQLTGIGQDFAFKLNLVPTTQPIINGIDGASQKAEGAGHASHYISFPRLLASGTLDIQGKEFTVEGAAWMDHEFFSDSMSNTESGWDWISVQMDDHTELMLYRLRHRDGSLDPYSSGTLIDSSGKSQYLSNHDFTMVPSGDSWRSLETGATYPIAWHVSVPKAGLSFNIATQLKSQEMISRIGPSYWEGAIEIYGEKYSKKIQGSGYLEMTGYAPIKLSGIPIVP